MTNLRLHFDKPLIKAVIKERINRFIFIVELDGTEVEAHCPSGGTIAGIPRKLMTQLPCLLSDHGDNTTRRTRYTVEAISLDNCHTYMGINQTASNHYVHQFLQDKNVQNTLDIDGIVSREKKLGNSRIDFKVDNTYIEVKTMVAEYYGKASKQLRALMKPQEPSVERMQKHIRELTHEVNTHKSKAIVLTVFQYDAPKFEPPVDNPKYAAFVNDLRAAKASGVRQIRMNLCVTDTHIELLSITENEVI